LIDSRLWQAKKRWWENKWEKRRRPLNLLRFIRNCHIHATNSTDDWIFTQQPYFLELLPELVVGLWEVCRREEGLRNHFLVQEHLRPLFFPSLDLPCKRWF
jgi:hypothetical protein